MRHQHKTEYLTGIAVFSMIGRDEPFISPVPWEQSFVVIISEQSETSCVWLNPSLVCIASPIGSSAVSAAQRVVPPRVTSKYELRQRKRQEGALLTFHWYTWIAVDIQHHNWRGVDWNPPDADFIEQVSLVSAFSSHPFTDVSDATGDYLSSLNVPTCSPTV